MSKRTYYFSHYESPNIVIVPTASQSPKKPKIDVSTPNQQNQSPSHDLSFLDDIDIDEIIKCLNNCDQDSNAIQDQCRNINNQLSDSDQHSHTIHSKEDNCEDFENIQKLKDNTKTMLDDDVIENKEKIKCEQVVNNNDNNEVEKKNDKENTATEPSRICSENIHARIKTTENLDKNTENEKDTEVFELEVVKTHQDLSKNSKKDLFKMGDIKETNKNTNTMIENNSENITNKDSKLIDSVNKTEFYINNTQETINLDIEVNSNIEKINESDIENPNEEIIVKNNRTNCEDENKKDVSKLSVNVSEILPNKEECVTEMHNKKILQPDEKKEVLKICADVVTAIETTISYINNIEKKVSNKETNNECAPKVDDNIKLNKITQNFKDEKITKNLSINNTKSKISTSSPKSVVTCKADIILSKSLEERLWKYFHVKYTVLSVIHYGSYSKIMKCKDPTGKKYAVKILNKDRDKYYLGIQKEKMLTEMQADIPKENLFCVYLKSGFSLQRTWCFMMDYYPKNLKQAMSESMKPFHIDMVQNLARQLVAAVTTLRSNNIVHSDIKPSHILLNYSNEKLKLCGFDEAYYETFVIAPNIGTANYRAPEIILGLPAGFSIDVWSTAVVLHEMATGIKLFPGYRNGTILFQQMCILGFIPGEMLLLACYRDEYFIRGGFKRRLGPNGENTIIMYKNNFYDRSQKVLNTVRNAYNKHWRPGATKTKINSDLRKIHLFVSLLRKMLVLCPTYRKPIEFVFADPFIFEMFD